MRKLWHHVAVEQRLFWRSRESAIFTFFLPIVLYLLLAAVYGNRRIQGTHGAAFLVAGLLGYGAVATAFAGLAITLVIRRESGVLRRLRTTPLSPMVYISATLLSTLIVFAIEAVLLVLLARVAYGVPLPTTPGSLVLALIVAVLSLASLGIAVTGAVKTAEGSSAVINAIYLPVIFISGAFFSRNAMPGFLRVIGAVLPPTYLIQLVQSILLHGRSITTQWRPLAALIAWGIIGALIAVQSFRWQPRP